jgi:hypothetical protein
MKMDRKKYKKWNEEIQTPMILYLFGYTDDISMIVRTKVSIVFQEIVN